MKTKTKTKTKTILVFERNRPIQIEVNRVLLDAIELASGELIPIPKEIDLEKLRYGDTFLIELYRGRVRPIPRPQAQADAQEAIEVAVTKAADQLSHVKERYKKIVKSLERGVSPQEVEELKELLDELESGEVFQVNLAEVYNQPITMPIEIGVAGKWKKITQQGFLDTGAQICLISDVLASKLNVTPSGAVHIQGINNSIRKIPAATLKFRFLDTNKAFESRCAIVKDLAKRTGGYEILIPVSFLNWHKQQGGKDLV